MADVAALMNALPDGVVLVSQEGSMLMANQALLAMTGFTADELVGQRVEVLVPEGDRAMHARQREGFSLAPTLRPMNTGIDTRLVCKDGTELKVEIHIGPIEWQGLTAFLATIRL